MEQLDIALLQKRDHRHLLDLIARYEGADQLAKGAIYREILQLVTTHAFAEETVLFPVARWRAPNGEKLTAAIESRHQRINELLLELDGMQPGAPPFDERAFEAFALLRDDLLAEENELLPDLASTLSKRAMRVVGSVWWVMRRTAPNRPHPRVSRRPPENVLAALPLAIYDRLLRRIKET
jgi:hypothetical protein